MSLIALPSSLCPSSFSMVLQSMQRSFASPYGGSEQVVDMLNDRWLISLTLPNLFEEAPAVEAFINALRGMVNTVALFHWARQKPRGSMRGAPKANGVLAGADSILIFTTPGATLRAGDMFGAGGLLFQVAEDCVADGTGNLLTPVVNRVRRDLAALTPVVWDKPTVPFRLVSVPPGVNHVPGFATPVSLDFAEAV